MIIHNNHDDIIYAQTQCNFLACHSYCVRTCHGIIYYYVYLLVLSLDPLGACDVLNVLLPGDKLVPHCVLHWPEEPVEMFVGQ